MLHAKVAMLVALGGALGSAARYLVSAAAMHYLGAGFPWGTFFVNVAGCFLMGLIAGFAVHTSSVNTELRFFLATGFLGGFTTFSAFALDTATLWDRSLAISGAYVAASVVISIAALYFGLALAKLAS